MNRTNIIQLIYRDFNAYRANIVLLSLFMLTVSMFITFINTNTLGVFTSGIGNIIMVVIGAFAMDQSGSVVRMHTASLPVTRREVVFARFGTTVMIVLINTIIHFIIFNLLTMIIHDQPVFTDLGILIFACVYGIFQLSIYFIIFYRVNLIVSVIIFVMPAVLWTAVSPKSGFLNDYVPGDIMALGTFTLATILLCLLSYYSTVAYFNKKDL